MNTQSQTRSHTGNSVQFGIGFLLVLVTLCAIPLGRIGEAYRRSLVEAEVIGRFKPSRVEYDYQVDSDGKPIKNAQPKGPKWVRRWLGDHVFARVRSVVIDSGRTRPRQDIDSLNGLNKLESLESLHLHVDQVDDITGVGGLQRLRELVLVNHHAGVDLEPLASLPELRTLSLVRSYDTSLSPLRGLRKLDTFSLSGWGFRQNRLPVFADGAKLPLETLKQLTVTYCELDMRPGKKQIAPKRLSFLETLNVRKGMIKGLAEVLEAPRLREIKIFRSGGFDLKHDEVSMPSLEEAEFEVCPSLSSLEGLSHSTRLKSISITSCPMLTDVDGLMNARVLEKVTISDCEEFRSLAGLAEKRGVKSLSLAALGNLKSLHGLSATSLTRVALVECAVSDISALRGATKLAQLHLIDCTELGSVDAISASDSLTYLNILRCPRIRDLSVVPTHKLRYLKLRGPPLFATLERRISEAKLLQTFRLGEAPDVTSLGFLDGLDQLRSVNVVQLDNLQAFGSYDSVRLPSIRRIEVYRCPRLERLDGARLFSAAEVLVLHDCESLADVSALESYDRLRFLKISKCPRVTQVDVVRRLKSLWRVELEETGVSYDKALELAEQLPNVSVFLNGKRIGARTDQV